MNEIVIAGPSGGVRPGNRRIASQGIELFYMEGKSSREPLTEKETGLSISVRKRG